MVIPVVRDVLGLDAVGLARARAAAVERARSRAAERGGPRHDARPRRSPISARSGVDHFTGVIALGQTSLLTVGRAVPRVSPTPTARWRVRTTFHATLNADHRTIDGAEAARLLVAFTEAAEGMTADFQEEA